MRRQGGQPKSDFPLLGGRGVSQIISLIEFMTSRQSKINTGPFTKLFLTFFYLYIENHQPDIAESKFHEKFLLALFPQYNRNIAENMPDNWF